MLSETHTRLLTRVRHLLERMYAAQWDLKTARLNAPRKHGAERRATHRAHVDSLLVQVRALQEEYQATANALEQAMLDVEADADRLEETR